MIIQHLNKQATECDNQLAATCLFTPTFFGEQFWLVK